MSQLLINKGAKFVVMARSGRMWTSVGVLTAAEALARTAQFREAGVTSVEVIDKEGNTFEPEQLETISRLENGRS